jgi:hypothetical protein
MGYFAGIEKVQVGKQGNYFLPGVYAVRVKKVLIKDSFKSGRLCIVETLVTASNNDKVAVGSERSWTVKMGQMGFSNLNRFLIAALGYDLDTPEAAKTIENADKLLTEAVDNGALNGIGIALEVFTTKTKAGNEFNVHSWTPLKKS